MKLTQAKMNALNNLMESLEAELQESLEEMAEGGSAIPEHSFLADAFLQVDAEFFDGAFAKANEIGKEQDLSGDGSESYFAAREREAMKEFQKWER